MDQKKIQKTNKETGGSWTDPPEDKEVVMFTLEELEQFAAFAEAGTLSQAAEKLHISQPTITRTMQHLEECFKVPLFG